MGNDREEIQEFKVRYRTKFYKRKDKLGKIHYEWNNSSMFYTQEQMLNLFNVLHKCSILHTWSCPLDDPECREDCGSYGCGN
jgi:hypothetical protein